MALTLSGFYLGTLRNTRDSTIRAVLGEFMLAQWEKDYFNAMMSVRWRWVGANHCMIHWAHVASAVRLYSGPLSIRLHEKGIVSTAQKEPEFACPTPHMIQQRLTT